jgi:hypothetical protein
MWDQSDIKGKMFKYPYRIKYQILRIEENSHSVWLNAALSKLSMLATILNIKGRYTGLLYLVLMVNCLTGQSRKQFRSLYGSVHISPSL